MKIKLTIVLILLLFAFSGLNKMNAQPQLWGITSQGGANDMGVIFEWDPFSNDFTKKFEFGNGTNGTIPEGSLTLSNGKLYGMTGNGGANDFGVIFEWDPSDNTYTKKIDFDGTNGAWPDGNSLTLSGGKFYGMTNYGGANDFGVIFEWDPVSNVFTKKIDFDGTNGTYPVGSLTLRDGKFYGMTFWGGANDLGVIFKWDPSDNTYTKKIDFNGSGNGSYPLGSLTLSGGKFFGMTKMGGSTNLGVIFDWDPVSNDFTKKIDFDGTNGANPYCSLTLSDGKFYGTTVWGGTNDLGVIFEWDPVSNDFTKKIDFDGTNGSYPWGSLALSGGKFYGMTYGGGANDMGVIYKWDPATNDITKKIDFNGPGNGSYPMMTQLLDNSTYWVGSVSTDWNTATNWSPTGVPGALEDVIIPVTATHMPDVNVPGLSCNNILIQDGATLTIDPGIVLTVNGTITVESP